MPATLHLLPARLLLVLLAAVMAVAALTLALSTVSHSPSGVQGASTHASGKYSQRSVTWN